MRIRLVSRSAVQTDIERIRAALERLEGGRDILPSPDFQRDDFEAEGAGRRLNLAHFQYGEAISNIAQDRQAAQARDHLAQDFKALGSQIGSLTRQSSGVAARSRQTGDKAGQRPGLPPPRTRSGSLMSPASTATTAVGARRDDGVDLEPDELGRDFGEALLASLAPAILDRDGATLDPAEFAQSLHKGGGPFGSGRTRALAQETNGRHRRLLRARRKRHRCRAGQSPAMNPRRLMLPRRLKPGQRIGPD